MTLTAQAPVLVSFLLAMVRCAAWLFFAPPFNTRAIPSTVKVGLAMALALPISGKLVNQVPPVEFPALFTAIILQVVIGLALGFATYLIFAALQAAGDLIDFFGGFSMATALDPLSMSQSSPFGRLNSTLAITLLFVIDGHLLLLRGFYTSYQALPLDAAISSGDMSRVLTVGVGQFFLAALQIAAPLIGVLFLVDIGLGLLTKISPSLNAFSLGFPAKIMVTVLLVGTMLPIMPTIVRTLVDTMLRAMAGISGG